MVHHQDDGSVEFAYFRPGAQCVHLAGDFNQWGSQPQAMTRDEHGWWRLRLALPSGEYRFKYVVDEKIWEADFAAFGVEMCPTGGWNSVLWIEPRNAETTQRQAA